MEEHKFMVVCRPTKEIAVPYGQAERDHCEKCREEIWVSPRSRLRQKELGARLYCAVCGLGAAEGQKHVIMGSRNQIEELNRSLEGTGKTVLPLFAVKADADEVTRMAQEGATLEEIEKCLNARPPGEEEEKEEK